MDGHTTVFVHVYVCTMFEQIIAKLSTGLCKPYYKPFINFNTSFRVNFQFAAGVQNLLTLVQQILASQDLC